ncbi:hypothetical protein FLJC2902T_25350 [Flavobacterium limnosediminis JC2902]|uniref:Lipoprotein n=1 Tax=Flavobacterium limnosediminis JC2902 TaxID=1341181 RepID=V6SIN6_9FLAO|nr:hypothetical protein [Flavobacterium limnosediminis]ESU26563.1 hypothetical protein FLJC2902T_25350 [Flavobacterium limnosediminis JC2902]
MNNILKSLILVLFLSSCSGEKVMFDIDEETRKAPNGKIDMREVKIFHLQHKVEIDKKG